MSYWDSYKVSPPVGIGKGGYCAIFPYQLAKQLGNPCTQYLYFPHINMYGTCTFYNQMLSLKLLSITHTSMPTGGPTLSLLFINSSHVLKLATDKII